MRVSFSQSYDKMSLNVSQKQDDIGKLSTIITTGKKINAPQDDPYGWTQSTNYTQAARQVESLQSNITFANGWNAVTEQALSAMAGGSNNSQDDWLTQATKIAEEAKTADPESLPGLAKSIDNIIRQVVDMGNTKSGNSYVFNGSNTGTEPFSIEESGGLVSAVDWNSPDSTELTVRVGTNANATLNIPGTTAFNKDGTTCNTSGDLFQSLIDLRAGISSGSTAAINSAESEVAANRENIIKQITTVGSRQADLNTKNDILTSLKNKDEDQLSSINDADMAQAITELQQKQTVYEAALSVTKLVSGMNLTQYL